MPVFFDGDEQMVLQFQPGKLGVGKGRITLEPAAQSEQMILESGFLLP